MRIILIDNYDSFTYNIVHYLEQLDVDVDVVFNDAAQSPEWSKYDAVVISPGPGLPEESNHLMEWIGQIPKSLPVLGICLGLQALVVFKGGRLRRLEHPLHGKKGSISEMNDHGIWSGIEIPIAIGHYHSWVADEAYLSEEWRILAKDKSGLIMAIQHVDQPWCALQFHPESILSEKGILWFKHWILNCVAIKFLP